MKDREHEDQDQDDDDNRAAEEILARLRRQRSLPA